MAVENKTWDFSEFGLGGDPDDGSGEPLTDDEEDEGVDDTDDVDDTDPFADLGDETEPVEAPHTAPQPAPVANEPHNEHVHTADDVDRLIADLEKRKGKLEGYIQKFNAGGATTFVKTSYLEGKSDREIKQIRWGVYSSIVAAENDKDLIYTFDNREPYTAIACDILQKAKEQLGAKLQGAVLYDCIAHNLANLDAQYDYTAYITCSNCHAKVLQSRFNGADTAICDNCHCRIDTNGNVVETNVTTGCPSCEGHTIAKDTKNVCDPCKKAFNDIIEFREKVYTYSEGIANQIDGVVFGVYSFLLDVYKYYNGLIDPPTGILGMLTEIKGQSEGSAGISRSSAVCASITPKGTFSKTTTASRGARGNYLLLDTYWKAIARGIGKDVKPEILGAVKNSKSNEENVCKLTGPSLNTFRCLSGFHLYHLFGFYRMGDSIIRIQNLENIGVDRVSAVGEDSLLNLGEEELAQNFSNFLAVRLQTVIWKYIYLHSGNPKTEGSLAHFMADALKRGEIDQSKELELADKLFNMANSVASIYKNMIVCTMFTESQVQIDIICSDISEHTRHIGDNIVKELIMLCTKGSTSYANAFSNARKAPDIIFSGKSDAIKALATNRESVLTSFIVVTDPDLHFAFPLFAYDVMHKQKLKQEQGLSGVGAEPGDVLLGETMDRQMVYLKSLMKSEGVLLFAGSRAGKGVLTLALLGTLLMSGNPIAYIDAKPEMSIAVKNLALEKGTNILALETKQPYTTSRTSHWTGASLGAVQAFTREQTNWRNQHSPEMVALWKKYYGVEPPDMSAATYILYTKIVQLAFALQKRLVEKGKKKRCIFILDEVTQATGPKALVAVNNWLSTVEAKIRDNYKKGNDKKNPDEEAAKLAQNALNMLQYLVGVHSGKDWEFANKTIDWNKSMFGRELATSLNLIKEGTIPLFIFIGQEFKHLIECNGSYGDTTPWFSLLGKRIGSAGIIIQGNWHQDDSSYIEKSASGDTDYWATHPAFTEAIKSTVEYKEKYIHCGGDTGKSGFFVVKQGNTEPTMLRSYLVLNENSAEYTEGSTNIRGRVEKALNGSKSKDMQNKLNALLYENYDPVLLDKLSAPAPSDDSPDQPYSAIRDKNCNAVRNPGVGFQGYMDMLSADSGGFYTGYDELQGLFNELAIAKIKQRNGAYTIEDYIYDMSPDTFLLDTELLIDDVETFKQTRRANGGILLEDEGTDLNYNEEDEGEITGGSGADDFGIGGFEAGSTGDTGDSGADNLDYTADVIPEEPMDTSMEDTTPNDGITLFRNFRSQVDTFKRNVQNFAKSLATIDETQVLNASEAAYQAMLNAFRQQNRIYGESYSLAKWQDLLGRFNEADGQNKFVDVPEAEQNEFAEVFEETDILIDELGIKIEKINEVIHKRGRR